MCGIAGWIDFKQDLQNKDKTMNAMADTLRDRGPDAGGFWKSNEAYIVHRRLIVVDPENGKQPMIRNFDGIEYVLTYNGELYNTEDIRVKLAALGYTFEGHSDTEVLLLSYIAWGERCVDEFNGIYAFAIWNSRERTLFLARDRIGVKPLFYYPYEDGLLFGSELKTLLAHPYIKPKLAESGVASIMLLGPGRAPGDGVFKGVYELKPGCCAMFSRDGLCVHEYWSLSAKEHTDTQEQTIERVRELLFDSIKRQLVSDVPLCTFLSGGLDSSIISAVTAKIYKDEGRALHTYSVDYKDNDKNFKASAFQPNADAPWIELMSKYIDSAHHDVLVDTPQLIEALYDATRARDLPGMADVDSSLYLFCREVKRNYTVAVSGECADELFGGYPWYHNQAILFNESFPWSQSTAQRIGIMRQDALGDIDPFEYVEAHYKATVGDTSALQGDTPLNRRMREMFMLNIKWFMQTLLDRKDRMSMTCGLEVRVPFCDHRLTEYVYNIPWEMKAVDGREKGLLRHAVSDLLPDEILWRKKSPYPKTHNPNYLNGCKTILQAILHDKHNRICDILDKKKLQQLIDTDAKSFGGTPWYGQLMTDAQILAYLIQMEYWLKRYNVEIV